MIITNERTAISFRQRFSLWITLGLMFLLQATATHAAAFLYAVDEVDTSIRMIEMTTGVEISAKTLIISGVTARNRFDSVLGAAINPLSGVMYAVLDLKDKDTKVLTRKFVSINPRSGIATDIALIGDELSGLAFNSTGTLYAVTANSVLYTVDPGTGVFTFVTNLGNGLDGETIAFNPDDGRLYHASGMGGAATDKIFESIDLNTLAVSNSPLSGDTDISQQTLSLVYDRAQGLFLGFRNDGGQGSGEYFSVTTTGIETLISIMPTSEKSLAFLDTDLLPAAPGFDERVLRVYAVDRDGPYLSQIDPDTGAEIDLIGITLADPVTQANITLTGASGLAMNPLNREFFATVVVLGERSNHRLVRLDPLTGVATLIGLTGHIFSGLTFDAAGTLYAVSSDEDGFTASWLFSIDTANAFVSILFDFGTARTPGDGEIIAFNSNDGLLYHMSGNTGTGKIVETIDLTADFARTPVGQSGGSLTQATALVYDPLRDIFMGADANAGGIFTMEPGGFISNLPPNRSVPLKGFGLIPACSAIQYIDAGVWTNFSLPCSVTPNTVADIFGGLNLDDLDPVNYGNTWGVFGRNASTQAYYLVDIADPLLEGNGYWVFSPTTTQVNINGSPAAVNDINLVGVTEGRDNYVGHNQSVSVDWDQVQVVDTDGTVYNHGSYDHLMSRIMNKWNGSAYIPFDGNPLGTLGTLDPFDAVWVHAFAPDIKLRIPVNAAAAAASVAPLASTVESFSSIQGQVVKKPKKPKNEPWYIRLIASSGDMEDPGNVLGQMDTATEGNDPHDLEEPAPFGSRYLSILFTNPLFEEVNWGFTTDFRAMTKNPQGVWPFVVKAHAGISEVTISWQGEDYLFKDAWLVDENNGEMIRAKAGESYTFDIFDGEHHFRFEVGDD